MKFTHDRLTLNEKPTNSSIREIAIGEFKKRFPQVKNIECADLWNEELYEDEFFEIIIYYDNDHKHCYGKFYEEGGSIFVDLEYTDEH